MDWWDGRPERAHRAAWLRAGREIPEGWHIHHHCENRLCVNVDHLEAMPARQHHQLHRPLSTHCPRGHERTAENSIWYAHGRHCIDCRPFENRERRERNAAKVLAAKAEDA